MWGPLLFRLILAQSILRIPSHGRFPGPDEAGTPFRFCLELTLVTFHNRLQYSTTSKSSNFFDSSVFVAFVRAWNCRRLYFLVLCSLLSLRPLPPLPSWPRNAVRVVCYPSTSPLSRPADAELRLRYLIRSDFLARGLVLLRIHLRSSRVCSVHTNGSKQLMVSPVIPRTKLEMPSAFGYILGCRQRVLPSPSQHASKYFLCKVTV